MSRTPAPYAPAPSDFTLLCDVIRAVAHASGLPPEDADDFTQAVHLKLLERNYAPLAQFAGRSSLRTYLTVVVRRLLLDWRDQRYGKWRPSSCARRLGPAAVDLDRLMSRDGHPVDEAIAIMEDRPAGPRGAILRELAAQLPLRVRMQTVLTDDIEALSVGGFDDPVEAGQAAAERRRVLRRLRHAYRRLAPDDRRLLQLHFDRSLSIATIASMLGVPAKPLYRRMARLLRSLKRQVMAASTATVN